MPEYHGTDGYLDVSYAPYRTRIADAIVNSSMEFGFPYVDYNGPTQVKNLTTFVKLCSNTYQVYTSTLKRINPK